MSVTHLRVGEDLLQRGVSARPGVGTCAGRRSIQFDLLDEATAAEVGVSLRSRVDVDVDVLVVHGQTVDDGGLRSIVALLAMRRSSGCSGWVALPNAQVSASWRISLK